MPEELAAAGHGLLVFLIPNLMKLYGQDLESPKLPAGLAVYAKAIAGFVKTAGASASPESSAV
jgi:hypothetical protein